MLQEEEYWWDAYDGEGHAEHPKEKVYSEAQARSHSLLDGVQGGLEVWRECVDLPHGQIHHGWWLWLWGRFPWRRHCRGTTGLLALEGMGWVGGGEGGRDSSELQAFKSPSWRVGLQKCFLKNIERRDEC